MKYSLIVICLLFMVGCSDDSSEFIDTPPDNSPTLIFEGNDTGVAGLTDESLEILTAGKVIIQFSFPDKKIIGIDNRTIGYLNDEEVKLLQEFFSIIKEAE